MHSIVGIVEMPPFERHRQESENFLPMGMHKFGKETMSLWCVPKKNPTLYQKIPRFGAKCFWYILGVLLVHLRTLFLYNFWGVFGSDKGGGGVQFRGFQVHIGGFQYISSGFCQTFSRLFFMHIACRRWLFWDWKYDTNAYRWVGGEYQKKPPLCTKKTPVLVQNVPKKPPAKMYQKNPRNVPETPRGSFLVHFGVVQGVFGTFWGGFFGTFRRVFMVHFGGFMGSPPQKKLYAQV